VRKLRESHESEVIAAFLRAEIDSPRWGAKIRTLLGQHEQSVSVVRMPDLGSSSQNSYRQRLLGEFRGWSDRLLFAGFPQDVMWSRVQLDRNELDAIKYINYSYWVELSGGSRQPRDAARRIAAGLAEEHRHGYEAIAERIRQRGALPEMILVADRAEGRLVVLEGNARLTGYILAGEQAPESIEALFGLSPKMPKWGLY
jgi:hypothetical protein